MSDHNRRSAEQVLYIIACAAPPAMDVQVLIDLAQQDGWDVCLIATPRAFQWLDVPSLAGRTGHPVRHDYELPGEPDLLPEPDAIIVAPATFNSINKWAAGIADTLALVLLCEATGKGLPVVVLPYLNAAQGEHPALGEGVDRLRHMGVRVLFGPDVLPLHRPRQGKREQFPWHLALRALKEASAHQMEEPPGQLKELNFTVDDAAHGRFASSLQGRRRQDNILGDPSLLALSQLARDSHARANYDNLRPGR